MRFSPGAAPMQLLQRYGLRVDQPVIFTLSRLSKYDSYKNIDKLIDALPELLVEFPDLKLVIAGTGDDQQRLQNLVNQNGTNTPNASKYSFFAPLSSN